MTWMVGLWNYRMKLIYDMNGWIVKLWNEIMLSGRVGERTGSPTDGPKNYPYENIFN